MALDAGQSRPWLDAFDLRVFLVQNIKDPTCAGAGY